MKRLLFTLLLLSLSGFSFSSVYKDNAKASYYADKFHGRKTANGEIFNMYDMTCAHKSLPFGTKLKVTNLDNGKSVEVRVNDRGPFVAGREVDLSKAAAVKLDMIKTGTARVKIEILDGKTDSSESTSASTLVSYKNT
ncbi:MAG: septal ring lytic transglycosylase RlpA family protein, partial [Treponema sp.]|nr:septal ring lytic transglycosylase RlpA family protein [Treponema sp.]